MLQRVRRAIEREVSEVCGIIVVDDGSEDGTAELLRDYIRDTDKERQMHIGGDYDSEIRTPEITVVRHEKNMGKGCALLSGFKYAESSGFSHVLTIDSDGQHYPEDIPVLVAAANEHPDDIIVGRRDLKADGMPAGNTFANKFSNFWFQLQTAHKLEDTQTGFRIYPLSQLRWKSLITSRYEAELELMVFAAWHGTDFVSCPVRVYYPPAELRVTHFRPYADFARITVLNTVLCAGALLYGYPSMLLRALYRKLATNCGTRKRDRV